MSTSARKLQAEVDKTSKKIYEGIDEFHELLKKYDEASNPSHKEKVEGELKREIKKLQRLRDQVKVWQASSEIKDKDQLHDARKAIEAEMEKFKVLEKEMKIKAFSKEGLILSTKLDPKEKEKQVLTSWINGCVSKLSSEVDQFEAEMESILAASKKGKKLEQSKQERTDELGHHVERHRFHIDKLETILRSMENSILGPDDVSEVKDNVDYYVDCSQENDFKEPDDIYEGLDLIESKNRSAEEDRSKAANTLSAASSPTIAPNVTPVQSALPSKKDISSSLMKNDSMVSEHKPNTKVERPPEDPDSGKTSPPSVMSKVSGPSFASAALMGKGKAQVSTSFGPEDSLGDVSAKAFDSLKSRLKSLPNEIGPLDMMFKYVPGNVDSDLNRPNYPRNPVTSPSYYPQSHSSVLDNPAMFEKYDLDTLFYIFYFLPKTTSQYLAAKELKRQSWRFHKKYHTWFQRHEEPKTITPEYEHGTYIYFDFEGSWCQRKKAEFTFEYRFLEDDDQEAQI